MQRLPCRISLPNSLFGHLMPPEDSLDSAENVLAVGDGITRDPLRCKDFGGKSMEKILESYPNPSGARYAADAFCRVFLKDGKTIQNQADVGRIFAKANFEITRLNRRAIKKADYLINDFYGCAAAGACIVGRKLFWGVIADCGVKIFSKTGKLKLQTPNSMALFESQTAAGRIKFKWEKPEGRRLVRSEYRNNPAAIIDGQCVSYGALTGEKAAEPFVMTGELTLAKGDLVLVYSDGFEPLFKRPDFFKTVYGATESFIEQRLVPFSLKMAKEDYAKYGKERSVLALIY